MKNKTKIKLEIRAYKSGDEDQIIQLWIDCGLVVPQNNPLKDIHRKLKVNPEWFLIGELDNNITATCIAGYEGHRGWINYLAVSPQYQRKGYAAVIMEKAEELLTAAGCPKINLQVRTSNRSVIEFYKNIGYKIDEVTSLGKRLDPDES